MKRKKSKNQRGATLLESIICIMVLGVLLLPMLQIFFWCMQYLFAEYSAFYTARSLSLGYAYNVTNNHARVAAIGMSGRNMSDRALIGSSFRRKERLAEEYMRHGDSSGINFEYWRSSSNTLPYVEIWKNPSGERSSAKITLYNFPLLAPKLLQLFTPGEVNPSAEVTLYNYSDKYLDE